MASRSRVDEARGSWPSLRHRRRASAPGSSSPGRGRASRPALRRPTTRSGRSRGAGTRRCWTRSVARCPHPPVHARNLFHTSVAMWDAWAAYDPTASGVYRQGEAAAHRTWPRRATRRSATPPTASSARVTSRPSAATSRLSEFADVMDSLCYPLDVTATEGDTPAALGNRIAAAVMAAGMEDGSNQANGYAPTRTTRRSTSRSSSLAPGSR